MNILFFQVIIFVKDRSYIILCYLLPTEPYTVRTQVPTDPLGSVCKVYFTVSVRKNVRKRKRLE